MTSLGKYEELDRLIHKVSCGDYESFKTLLIKYRPLIDKEVSKILFNQREGSVVCGRSEKADIKSTTHILIWKMLVGDSPIEQTYYKSKHKYICQLAKCNKAFTELPMYETCKECKFLHEDREYAYERALFFIQSRAFKEGQKYHLTQHLRRHLPHKLGDILKAGCLSKDFIEFRRDYIPKEVNIGDSFDDEEKDSNYIDKFTYDDLRKGIFPISNRKPVSINGLGDWYYHIKEKDCYVYDLYNKQLDLSKKIIDKINALYPYVCHTPCGWKQADTDMLKSQLYKGIVTQEGLNSGSYTRRQVKDSNNLWFWLERVGKRFFPNAPRERDSLLEKNDRKIFRKKYKPHTHAIDSEHRAFIRKHYLSIGKDIRFYDPIGDVVVNNHYTRPKGEFEEVKQESISNRLTAECVKKQAKFKKEIKKHQHTLIGAKENLCDRSGYYGKRYV
jgi:hypothetical protein